MIRAFLLQFNAYALCETSAEAQDQARAFRSVAVAVGLEPGNGQVRTVSDAALERTPGLADALDRARRNQIAEPRLRDRAIRALSAHVAGDVSFAEEIVSSIERRTGGLSRAAALALAEAA